jgi:hypothetical protein
MDEEHAFTMSTNKLFNLHRNEMELLIDSGCSEHMVPSGIKVEEEREADIEVSQADGTKLKAIKKGTLKLQATIWNNKNLLKLTRVLVAKGLSIPLLSVISMLRNGMDVHFVDNQVKYTKKEKVIPIGHQTGSLLIIKMETVPTDDVF